MRMDSEQTKYDRVWADFVDATETIEIFKGFLLLVAGLNFNNNR